MVSPKITCALVIATYNWPDALELCLKSVLHQSVYPDEVIVADDGSGIETREVINRFSKRSTIKLLHIWHEDQGFRLAAIRNKAIAASSMKYIIQIDGDIIMHPKFIQDHLSFANQKTLLQGSRVLLGKHLSSALFKAKKTVISIAAPDIKRRENGIRIPPLSRYLLNRYKNRHPRYFARGANMSFWKMDFITINGYNEEFEGWGHEDSEFTLRFLKNGGKKMVIKFAAIAYHLFHPETASKARDERNWERLQEAVGNDVIRVKDGIDKYI